MSGGRTTLALLAGVAGGLLLAGSTTGIWLARSGDRDIGGVPVPDDRGVLGGQLAGELLPWGLAAVATALLLMVVRGRARRLAGIALLVVAAACAWPIARPVVGPSSGDLAGGFLAAVLGLGLVAAAGVLALRGSTPRLSARYDLDVDDADAEWRLAAEDREEP